MKNSYSLSGIKKTMSGLFYLTVIVLFAFNVKAETLVSSAQIESVMRKYQAKYHYVAIVKDYDSKYLTWQGKNCVSTAPSYPINFYGDITVDKAESLVDDIVNAFYGSGRSNISGLFLTESPQGKQSETNFSLTEPNSLSSWQDKLDYVEADINILTLFDAGSPQTIDNINKYGWGEDYYETSGSGCDLYLVENGSFSDAKDDAEDMWNTSNDSCGGIGVATGSYQSHNESLYCGDTKTLITDSYTAYVATNNVKFKTHLSKHTGSAELYLNLSDYYNSYFCTYYGTDGAASFNPVDVDNKYYQWQSPTVNEIWVSDYLFSQAVPSIPAPEREISSYEDDYTKISQKAWFVSKSLVTVTPEFDFQTDPTISIPSAQEQVFKDKDKHIVYAANKGCGFINGETVKGRILTGAITDSMRVEVQLSKEFDGNIASLNIDQTSINPTDTEYIYCFSPQHDDDPNNSYIPFTISASSTDKSTSIGFDAKIVYIQMLGDTTADPNECDRRKYYESDSESFSFTVKPNGYECCNRKDSAGEIIVPTLKKHENGDIEIFLSDISEGYILTPSFLELSLTGFTYNGNSNHLLLNYEDRRLVYGISAAWNQLGVSSNAGFVAEIDSQGNTIQSATTNANGTVNTVANSASPATHYRQYHYDDLSDPTKITGYTLAAGNVSREFIVEYDTTGRVSGVLGGSCSSCTSSGGNSFYTYDLDGNILTESDYEGNIIYEYDYDGEGRLITQWLGEKINLNPIKEIYYYDGYRDEYEYINPQDYSFTRYLIDIKGNDIAKYEFDDFNINASVIGFEPNDITAAGGFITTWDYTYNAGIATQVVEKSPRYNSAGSDVYFKRDILTPNTTNEIETAVIGAEEYQISKNVYANRTLNGITRQSLIQSYDARGLNYDSGWGHEYTSYEYDSATGGISRQDGVKRYQLNSSIPTQLRYAYTYNSDGTINTETVQDVFNDDTRVITTYLYDYLGHPAGTETRDNSGNLLSLTETICNGFGDEVAGIDSTGVATGKEYDSYGRILSEFIFAYPNDAALFANASYQDISGIYQNIDCLTQVRYYYDNNGRRTKTETAVNNGAFAYNNPQGWIATIYSYDSYGRQYQRQDDAYGLNLITTNIYDNQGRITKTIYPDGSWLETIRNARGLTIKTIEGYGYDVGDPENFLITEYDYDDSGNKIRQIEPSGIAYHWRYDGFDRVIRRPVIPARDSGTLLAASAYPQPVPLWQGGRFEPLNQYADGYGLRVYAKGDPVNNRDDWGLMSIDTFTYSYTYSNNSNERAAKKCSDWVAKELKNMEWLNSLHLCPCKKGKNDSNLTGWQRDNRAVSNKFHPGSHGGCFRSRRRLDNRKDIIFIGTDAILVETPIYSKSGQQCCYDRCGNLIKYGIGAGTPDRISSETNLIGHYIVDVRMFKYCKKIFGDTWVVENYLTVRPPNQGDCE